MEKEKKPLGSGTISAILITLTIFVICVTKAGYIPSVLGWIIGLMTGLPGGYFLFKFLTTIPTPDFNK